ncbi:Extradiol ring-cleavage dioxygenase, class III enzyme, subunit B [Lentinula detonsa]|uniref:Extradiol ring-cleavage dioxygenase, class III enzyme, subunit B n=1 Tax=Lentinula detonsa TaxID=2804962 RepID=A0A9W8NW01_9AGAR|nr:Extradiol ring-cleavage dioxygenase, class III enzyme, subunit B [Lentinula detonsa]
MNYYEFPQESYELKFKSRGDKQLAERLVALYKEVAQTTSKLEWRGFEGPGLDHGVFVPFRLVFGEELALPVVQVSIDSSMSPEVNWDLGQVVKVLREENVHQFTLSRTSVPSHPTLRSPYTILSIRLSYMLCKSRM